MNVIPNEHPPPDSTDLEGWRRAIQDGRYTRFRLEAIVAAIQDLGSCADKDVVNPLALHLSDVLLKILRGLVGMNHPNEGRNIIDRTYDKVIDALLKPKSADGKALREAFVPRVKYRLKDVLAEDARADQNEQNRKANEQKIRGGRNTQRGIDGTAQELFSPQKQARIIDENLDVAKTLSQISDDQKRLAFRLYMDGVPFKSKKSNSIAEALGVSEKTARVWVKEVQDFLSSVPAVQDMLKSNS